LIVVGRFLLQGVTARYDVGLDAFQALDDVAECGPD
jgi:hypothetical protein